MVKLKLIAICAIVLFVTSCGSVSKNHSYNFDQVRLELGMNDLEYLGETEVSVEYSTYLGLFKNIDRVNGELYNPVHKKELSIINGLFSDKTLNVAAYKLVEEFPTATYFQVVFETADKEKLFLGSVNKKTAKVKAYKLKN